jgi:chromosomal replication initiation ATPase DnaA
MATNARFPPPSKLRGIQREFSEAMQPPDEEAQTRWHNVLATLASQMTGPTFDTWIRPTSLLSWDTEIDGCGTPRTNVVIGTPDGYVRDWLGSRLATPIQHALSTATGSAVDVQFQVSDPAGAQALELVHSGVETPCPDSAS